MPVSHSFPLRTTLERVKIELFQGEVPLRLYPLGWSLRSIDQYAREAIVFRNLGLFFPTVTWAPWNWTAVYRGRQETTHIWQSDVAIRTGESRNRLDRSSLPSPSSSRWSKNLSLHRINTSVRRVCASGPARIRIRSTFLSPCSKPGDSKSNRPSNS